MASTLYLLSVLGLLAAMFRGIDGNIPGSLPIEDVKERCQNNSTAIFAHPGECQIFYNCSNDAVPNPNPRDSLTQYMDECPYPQLFSLETSRCMDFDQVDCGARKEPLDCDEYHRLVCFMCWHCSVLYHLPSCRGLPDGLNVYRGREWSPYYAVCRSQRPMLTGTCPRHLQMVQFPHPEKQRCVSLYEVPHEKSGLPFTMNCTRKADGLHLDDVTNRPDVYFQCHKGEVVEVDRCAAGTYFDELRDFCAESPLKNRIIHPE